MHFGSILEGSKIFKLLFILNVHVLRSEDGTEAKDITFLTLGIIQLWLPQKMSNFCKKAPS